MRWTHSWSLVRSFQIRLSMWKRIIYTGMSANRTYLQFKSSISVLPFICVSKSLKLLDILCNLYFLSWRHRVSRIDDVKSRSPTIMLDISRCINSLRTGTSCESELYERSYGHKNLMNWHHWYWAKASSLPSGVHKTYNLVAKA